MLAARLAEQLLALELPQRQRLALTVDDQFVTRPTARLALTLVVVVDRVPPRPELRRLAANEKERRPLRAVPLHAVMQREDGVPLLDDDDRVLRCRLLDFPGPLVDQVAGAHHDHAETADAPSAGVMLDRRHDRPQGLAGAHLAGADAGTETFQALGRSHDGMSLCRERRSSQRNLARHVDGGVVQRTHGASGFRAQRHAVLLHVFVDVRRRHDG